MLSVSNSVTFMRSRVIRTMLAVLAVMAPMSANSQTAWRPDRTVEIIVGAGPGAAADATARNLQRIAQERKLIPAPVNVINRSGAGYSIAWTYMNSHPGDGHYLALTALSLITNAITGTNPLTYTDVTPIAQLFTEYMVLVVRADSPIRDGRDAVERLKRDPTAHSIALAAALGNQNHIATGVALKAGGVDVRRLKVVIFDSSALSMTALLGGHVDLVAASASNVLGHLRAGRVRVLGISSPQRLAGDLAQVPTWREQGIDAVSDNWRGIIGPRGMTTAQVTYWEETFARIVETDEWKKDLEKNFLSPSFMKSAEAHRFLQTQHAALKALLTDLGLAKQ